jgi:hypothetical protein
MHADRPAELDPFRDELLDLTRHAHADRVGEDDLVGATDGQLFCERADLRRIDRALERAAEGDADRDGCPNPVGVRTVDDPLRRVNRLIDGRVLIPLVEGLRRGEREVHLVETGRRKTLVTQLVESQARIGHTLDTVDSLYDLLRAGHLRHARRVDEAACLDAREAGAREPVDELCPRARLEDLRLVLEAVSRPDVADRHLHRTPSCRSSSSRSSLRPSSCP